MTDVRRQCPHCYKWVRQRLNGLLRAHSAEPYRTRCPGSGELPWPWQDEAEAVDFGYNGKWTKSAHAGSWYPAANRPRNISDWYLCRQRQGATSLQFGPMSLQAAIALADHLNHAPELHHYHGHPLGDSSVWQDPSAEELVVRGLA